MSKSSGAGQIVNRAGLADVFGVSLPTIDDWVRRGCPVVTRGRRGVSWEFNTADVRRWDIEQQVGKSASEQQVSEKQLRLRNLRATTELQELALSKARGEVVPLADIERGLVRAFTEIRANLMVLPARVAQRTVGETEELKIKTILREEIRQALEALADSGLVMIAEFEDGEAEDD
jgi:phage terminase Nu1 subunit (DNA packaging protein)